MTSLDGESRHVTVKLKTSDFRLLSRRATLGHEIRSAAELLATARELLGRFGLPPETRFRLAGVGLSGFPEPDADGGQADLFASNEQESGPLRPSPLQ